MLEIMAVLPLCGCCPEEIKVLLSSNGILCRLNVNNVDCG